MSCTFTWINWICQFSGCRQCPGASDSEHFQRPSCMSHILADLRNYGSSNVCWKILQGIVKGFLTTKTYIVYPFLPLTVR